MLSSSAFWLIVSIALAAGFLQGMAGFGYNQLAVPLYLLLMPPAQAILVVLMLDLPVCFLALWHVRRHVRPALVVPLLTGVAVGTLPGVMLLTRLPEHSLRLFISCALALFAVLGLLGIRRRIGGSAVVATAGVGVLAGALNASAGIAGPPMLLFLVNQETEAGEFRAALQGAFIFAGGMTLLLVSRQPGMLAQPWHWTLWLTVPSLLGTWLGQRFNLHTSTLHRLALLVVLASSLTALGSALLG